MRISRTKASARTLDEKIPSTSPILVAATWRRLISDPPQPSPRFSGEILMPNGSAALQLLAASIRLRSCGRQVRCDHGDKVCGEARR